MEKTIDIEIKYSYGNELYYIKSWHKDHIKALTNRKTLTKKDIFALKQLGFTFNIVHLIQL